MSKPHAFMHDVSIEQCAHVLYRYLIAWSPDEWEINFTEGKWRAKSSRGEELAPQTRYEHAISAWHKELCSKHDIIGS
jgi:hypothetical protein